MAKLTNFIQEDYNNINKETDTLTTFITKAARNGIPVSNRSTKTPVPWWDLNCINCLKERKSAQKAHRRNPTITNKIAYKRLSAVCRKTFKHTKNRFLDNLHDLNKYKYQYGEDFEESPGDKR